MPFLHLPVQMASDGYGQQVELWRTVTANISYLMRSMSLTRFGHVFWQCFGFEVL
jgi:hypothetical protein